MDTTELLLKTVETLQAEMPARRTILQRLNEQPETKDNRIEEPTQTLPNMQRARFGQRSEKSVCVLGGAGRQTSLFHTPLRCFRA